MLKAILMTLATLAALTNTAFAQTETTTNSVSYSTPNRGAQRIETKGGTNPVVVGYARVQPSSSTTPAGVAIFGLRQNNVLVNEAGVPGVTTITSGRTYAEVNGAVNTGIAFANTNSAPVVISFNFTDQLGNDFGQGSFTLNANTQIARFLNEAPFNVRILSAFAGTFSFTASAPVAVIALRTLVNERSEFIVTTQTVVSLLDAPSSAPVLIAHFANGGGWTTQVILLNNTDAAINGSVQFFGEGSATADATPLTLTVNGQVAASFAYTIPARSSVNLRTSAVGGPTVTQVGSVRITPGGGTSAPAAFAVFSFATGGVTVSQSTVQAQPLGTTFRTYVEVTSRSAIAGAIQSGVAIANNSSTTATVNFELTLNDGTNTNLTAIVTIPPFGHISQFVHELFPTLNPPSDTPFRGVLRVISSNSIGIVSLRGRYNERLNFLLTTTPATNEASPSTTNELVFPHIVDQGGYTTQFILFSGIAGQSTTGTLRFFGQDGQALTLTIR